MKSARGRDRTGLADGPATSRSGWQRRGYTTGRAGQRRRQLSNCVFPRGRAGLSRGLREVQPNWLCWASSWGGCSPTSFPQRSTSFGHLSFPYLASKQFVSGARAVSSAPPALSLWEPLERVAADSCASGLGVTFAVSTAPGPFSRPRTVPSAGVRLESRAPREGGRSLGSAGGEGRASTQPARLPAGALRSVRPQPDASVGELVSPVARRAQLQPCRCYRSGRRGRGARRVQAGCWGAIGPPALLRSSASYLCKVKLLTHRKPS